VVTPAGPDGYFAAAGQAGDLALRQAGFGVMMDFETGHDGQHLVASWGVWEPTTQGQEAVTPPGGGPGKNFWNLTGKNFWNRHLQDAP
jgi:hypothetical protein